ncbi:MAG: type II secretion system secretin GspD, partial [Myxococcota bacterium]
MRLHLRSPYVAALALALVTSAPALAQDPAPSSGTVVTSNPDGSVTVSPSSPTSPQLPRDMSKANSVQLNFPQDSSLLTWVKFFADLRRMNFIIADVKELENKKITIISNQAVSPDAAWEAFLSALETNGYALSITGKTARLVKVGTPGGSVVGIGVPRETDAYVTQLIQLENTRVDDMSKIISGMLGAEAKIVAYPPTNTLIITDTGANIRKVYKIMRELDVASPRSTMVIYKMAFADAADVKTIIEQLYGVAEEASAAPVDTRSTRSTRSTRTTSRRPEPAAPTSEAVSAGDESKFIAQVIEDERTNSLIVLANEDGHAAVRELLTQLDQDIDVGGEIHVVYLEHAKAEDVANVLSSLSQGGSRTQQEGTRRQTAAQQAAGAAGRGTSPATRTTPATAAAGQEEGEGSALAAFDSGMRIAADEATNSLVIIASQADFQVVERVIDKLDIERKQVFVDAVVMELSSDDSMNLGLAAHLPTQPSNEAAGFIGAQLGATSLGLTQDALSGLALGVFGAGIDVPTIDPTTGTTTSISVPAFGIALNAIKGTGSTNIISNPSLMTLDNEEASIVVGRKIPFPTTSGLNNLGQPVISFQREDVAITLKITPRINSSNYVTLELEIEVQEVEDSAQSATVSASGGGFITSQRKLQSVALVADNQTMVIGGLVGTTEGKSETKVPVLGDIPLVGALFRSTNNKERKTNLMIFITPHIVDEPDDMIEIQRVKEAQRQEFLRRFYGKSREEFWDELQGLLRYSMNFVDDRSSYRGPTTVGHDLQLDGELLSDGTRQAIEDAIDEGRNGDPGNGAGELPEDALDIQD